jgi:hypothetical protein
MLAADPTLGREAVAAAAPDFTRANAVEYTMPAPDSAGSTVPPVGAGVGIPDPATVAVAPLVAPPAPVAQEEGAATFSDAQAEPQEVVATGAATDDIKAVASELEEARKEVARVREALVEGNKYLTKCIAREELLVDRLQAISPPDDNATAIRAYLNAQVAKGEERAARKKLITESGLDLKALASDLKSPLDAAMSRKTGRGTQRPVVPRK